MWRTHFPTLMMIFSPDLLLLLPSLCLQTKRKRGKGRRRRLLLASGTSDTASNDFAALCTFVITVSVLRTKAPDSHLLILCLGCWSADPISCRAESKLVNCSNYTACSLLGSCCCCCTVPQLSLSFSRKTVDNLSGFIYYMLLLNIEAFFPYWDTAQLLPLLPSAEILAQQSCTSTTPLTSANAGAADRLNTRQILGK